MQKLVAQMESKMQNMWLIRVKRDDQDTWQNFAFCNPNEPEANRQLQSARDCAKYVRVYRCDCVQAYDQES